MVGGHAYARVYRGYGYGYRYRGAYYHMNYYRYLRVHYYNPIFYFWANVPWPSPIIYNWGWAGTPWFGFYSGFFTPYPVYATASLWLTDYLLAANLQAAYQARAENFRTATLW